MPGPKRSEQRRRIDEDQMDAVLNDGEFSERSYDHHRQMLQDLGDAMIAEDDRLDEWQRKFIAGAQAAPALSSKQRAKIEELWNRLF